MIDHLLADAFLGGAVVIVFSLRFAKWVLQREDAQAEKRAKEEGKFSKTRGLDRHNAKVKIIAERIRWAKISSYGETMAIRRQADERILELDRRLMELEE